MPQAPDRYQPAWKRKTEGVERHKAGEREGQRGGSGLYQSYRYIQFRHRMKTRQRAIDAERVHQIYQELDPRSFKDYMSFLQSEDPLCVDCLEEGLIKPGRVMDHVIPIEKGGAVYEWENLEFRCDHHHNVKRATEDKQ